MSTEKLSRSEISKHFLSKNFMTPDILEYGQKGNYIYEISTGEFMDNLIFGVTVLTKNKYRSYSDNYEINKACYTIEEAREYIASL